MPILQGALLCDAAHDYNGLVSILGGFVAATYVGQLPAPAPVWFAGRVGFLKDEVESGHTMVVAADSPDDERVGEVIAVLPPNPQVVGSQIAELMSGSNLVFPFPFPMTREGIYWVSLTVDDIQLTRLPLKVIVGIPPPAAGA